MANYDIGTATGATNQQIAAAIKGVVDSGKSSEEIANMLQNPIASDALPPYVFTSIENMQLGHTVNGLYVNDYLTVGQSLKLTQDGRAGDFTVRLAADYTAEIAIDTLMGIYVPITGTDYVAVRVLQGFVTPDMFGVTTRNELQEMMDTTSVSTIFVTSDLRLDGQIVANQRITMLSRGGTLIFESGIEGSAAILATADGCDFRKLRMSNPNYLGNKETGSDRPYGISIEAHDVTVDQCNINGFQNPIAQRANGEWYRAKVTNNWLVDCLGAGGSYLAADGYGEDRGDGITIWGAGSIVSGNIILLKDGEDGRVGLHAEGLPASAVTAGNYADASVTFTGNHIAGAWRRGVSFEGMYGAVATGNTVVGATWYHFSIVQGCKGCSMDDNTGYHTADQVTWGAWSPKVCLQTFYGTVDSCSLSNNKFVLKDDSALRSMLIFNNTDDGIQTDCAMNNVQVEYLNDPSTVTITGALIDIFEYNGNKPIRPKIHNGTIKGISQVGGLRLGSCICPDIKGVTIENLDSSYTPNINGIFGASTDIIDPRVKDNSFIGWYNGMFVPSLTTGEFSNNYMDNVYNGIFSGASANGVLIEGNKFGAVDNARMTNVPTLNRYNVRNNQGQKLYIETTIDPDSLIDGATYTATVTVAGASLGDIVDAVPVGGLGGLLMTCYISATDTVKISLTNLTGASVDRPSTPFRVYVNKFGSLT
jgi:hypothetical protein